MRILVLAPGLAALVGAFCLYVTPASAEFTGKATEGKDGVSQVLVEGIGGTVDCEVGEANSKWAIKKGGLPAEKGPVLDIKFASWGECQLEYKEGTETKEVKATGGECEWETTETGTEHETKDKVVSTCTLKATIKEKLCEIKLTSEGNSELSSLTLTYSGEKHENLITNVAAGNVTVKAVGSGCEAGGITSSTTAKLGGFIESLGVTPGIALPMFMIFYGSSNQMTKVNETREAFVANNTMMTMAPGTKLREFGATAWFTIASETIAKCQTGPLNAGSSCKMKVTFSTASNAARTLYIQYLENATVVSQVAFIAAG